MKKMIRNTLLIFSVMLLMASCEDDFLERIPKDSLSEESFFNTANDLKTYVNGLYSIMPRYDYQGGAFGAINYRDMDADVQITARNITGSLDQRASDGLAPQNSGAWNNSFTQIRRANFFLDNYQKVNPRDLAANHFIGEGYFFRALHYYNFMVGFGDVPIILRPLNMSDLEELYRPRNSRYDVAKQIIKDLDSAIVNLDWKGEGEAKSGRINKEAALVMKARVALFEGTWEYYHGREGTEFAVQGQDGTEFLEMIEPAIQQLINHQGAVIYEDGGPFNEPYNQLFAIEDGHSVEGVFWFRDYTTSLIDRSHNFYGKASGTGRVAITRRQVGMYLDSDGVPQELSEKDLTTLNEMGQNLDPRFRQTIWTPDRGPLSAIPGRGAQGDEALRYPPISDAMDYYTSTGFRTWKGAVLDASQFRAGEQDDIFIRYAEGLLALAEAKAILGTITQDDLDKTVNVLRGRVDMVPMSLVEVNSWNITYDASEGFDPSASNIVNEIRRERTVELALEGFRLEDLKRWAAFEDAINGYKPKGAWLQEFLDYFNDPDTLASDGWAGTIDLSLVEGEDCATFDDGLINPYFQSTQFQEGGEGFWIDENRDYLNPVPKSEIQLYEENGVTLTQNPGWQ
jgi:hypothetical protein